MSWPKFPIFLLLALLYWPPGAQAGHDRGEPRYSLRVACDNIPSVVGVIEASKDGSAAEFLYEQRRQGWCKEFPQAKPLPVWFDRVVRDDLVWADGSLMYIIQLYDQTGFPVFIWGTAEMAHKRGWYPLGGPA